MKNIAENPLSWNIKDRRKHPGASSKVPPTSYGTEYGFCFDENGNITGENDDGISAYRADDELLKIIYN